MSDYTHINFGEKGESAEGRLRGFLLSILTPLRQEFARRLKVLRAEFPQHRLPCETCAFRSGTDDHPGFDRTILAFVAALETGAPFLCHHRMPRDRTGQWRPPMKGPRGKREIDWAKVEYCHAWMVLTSTVPAPFDIHTLIPAETCKRLAAIARGVDE